MENGELKIENAKRHPARDCLSFSIFHFQFSISLPRLLFLAAAAFNFCFALVSGLFTEAFFDWIGAPPPENVPWPAVAAVVAAFGALYAYAAWRPERADFAISFGLASKIVGPLAWLASVAMGESSSGLFPLVVVGDVAWWFPFLAYLLRRSPHRRTALIWIGVVLHLIAGVLLLSVAPGTERTANLSERQMWIAEHAALWTAAWLSWAMASLSLGALVAVWAARLMEERASRTIAVLACGIVWVGVACDLAGETMLAARATPSELTIAEFAAAYRTYQWLSPVVANGLYCLGGLGLSFLSWRTALVRGFAGIWGIAMWTVGLALTVAAIVEHLPAMTAAGAGVMLMFTPWSAWLGWKLRSAPTP